MSGNLKVGIGGLGVIGTEIAKALNQGIPGLELTKVSANNKSKATAAVAGFHNPPSVVSLAELSETCDIVIETAPAAVYDDIARPAIEAGRIFLTMSSGALLARPDLFDRAKETGARIIVPSGGVMAFDGIKAAGEGEIYSVELITRKPPQSLEGAPYLVNNNISVSGLSEPKKIFDGNAREAAEAFPANANVAASLSLAGIGPERTHVEIWADPTINVLSQEVRMKSESADFTLNMASFAMPDNPKTGSLTPKSAIAALRGLVATIRIGS